MGTWNAQEIGYVEIYWKAAGSREPKNGDLSTEGKGLGRNLTL